MDVLAPLGFDYCFFDVYFVFLLGTVLTPVVVATSYRC